MGLESSKLQNQNGRSRWTTVEEYGLPRENEHGFRMFVTIEYKNGFRRTVETTWDFYGNCFKYKNGIPVSEKIIAYQYKSLPEPFKE